MIVSRIIHVKVDRRQDALKVVMIFDIMGGIYLLKF